MKAERNMIEKYPDTKLWKDLSIRQRINADQMLINAYILLYAKLSAFEHPSFFSLKDYVDMDNCDPVIQRYKKSPSLVFSRDSLLGFSLGFFANILEKINSEFRLDRTARISDIARSAAEHYAKPEKT